MKRLPFLFAALLFGACAGDRYTTVTSPPQPTRAFATVTGLEQIAGPPLRSDKYEPDRVYLVTRPDTAYTVTSQWRARGSSIREWGSHIEFTDLDSGQNVQFDSAHQVTPMASRTDRPISSYAAEIKPPPANSDSPMITGARSYP